MHRRRRLLAWPTLRRDGVPWRAIQAASIAGGIAWAIVMAVVLSAPATSVFAWLLGTLIGGLAAVPLLKRVVNRFGRPSDPGGR
jgi:hypothetical protein